MQTHINIHHEQHGHGLPIFFVHGFSEDMGTWAQLVDLFQKNTAYNNYALHCIDLIGHGKSSKPRSAKYYGMDHVIKEIHRTIHTKLTNTSEKYILLGYSLGGRIAMHYALQHAKELQALILESAAFGIEDAAQRQARKEQDEKLAHMIEQNGIEYFEKYWSALDIFKSQQCLDAHSKAQIKHRRLQNQPHALAHTLRMTGQGKVAYIKHNILQLPLPILYIYGELDKKYAELAQALPMDAKNLTVRKIKQAGHNTHMEKPLDFFTVLINFLSQIK